MFSVWLVSFAAMDVSTEEIVLNYVKGGGPRVCETLSLNGFFFFASLALLQWNFLHSLIDSEYCYLHLLQWVKSVSLIVVRSWSCKTLH